MTTRPFPLFPIALLAALTLLAPPAWAQPGAAAPDPGRVFAELLRPYRTLEDYTVKLSAKVAMPTMRIPDFSATLYFKKPDRFHIETKSFAPIPRNSGLFNPLQFDPAKNRITRLRSENLGQTRTEVFRAEPLDPRSQVRHFQVWVGGSPLRILQVENLSVRGTRAVVTLSYRSVATGADAWLLPEKVHIRLSFPEGARPPEGAFGTQDSPLAGGMRRLDEMNGEGDIDIFYGDWQVNTGLADALFDRQKGR